jgi:thymidylate kinase
MTTRIVSFSGIDGAGKSTQISALENWLRETGHNTKLLTFWDDIVVGARMREAMSHAVFKGDEGIGSPEKPLERRDKNVTSAPVVAARFFLYFADAINLCRAVSAARRSNCDVVIFDRYIYDELANLPLHRPLTRAFIWFVLKIVPAPDVAYVIDADPEAARTRKPEYPLEFLRHNREAYLSLAKVSGNITVIEPLSIESAKAKIQQEFLRGLPGSKGTSSSPELCDEVAK